MNYMSEVAKMLGVEIGEEFYLKGFDEDLTENMYAIKHKFVIKRDGLYIIDEIENDKRSILLDNLISGKLEIIKLTKPILTDKEKEDLSGVIRLFRDEVISICKFESMRHCGYEFLSIKINNNVFKY